MQIRRKQKMKKTSFRLSKPAKHNDQKNRKNAAALSLYMSMGFSETGAGDEDETELALTLRQ